MPFTGNFKISNIIGLDIAGGDSLASIELAACLEGTDYPVGTTFILQATLDNAAETARANGRLISYVADTNLQQLSDLQSVGGLNLSWDTMTAGHPTGNFKTAVRVQEKRPGNSYVWGPWCSGSALTVASSATTTTTTAAPTTTTTAAPTTTTTAAPAADGAPYSINLTAANFSTTDVNSVVSGTGATAVQSSSGLTLTGNASGTVYGIFKHLVAPASARTYTLSFVPESGSLTPIDILALTPSDGTWGYRNPALCIRLSGAGSSDVTGSYINITKWDLADTKAHVANVAYTAGAIYHAKLVFTATTVTLNVYNASNTLLITSGALSLSALYTASLSGWGVMLYSTNWNPGTVRVLDFSVA